MGLRILLCLVLAGSTAWAQSAGSPALPSAPLTDTDADGDGLPDAWELQFGLSPADPAGDDGPDGDPDLDGISNGQEWRAGTHPRGHLVQHFAEGAVGAVFDTRFALVNPDPLHAATVLLRFLAPGGAARSHVILVPPRGRQTVEAREIDGIPAEFSTEVSSDRLVVAERSMRWYDATADGHAEGAVDMPSRTWYFAEGATHSGFRLFFLIANPSDEPARVTVDYFFQDGPPLRRTHVVPAQSRFTIWVNHQDPRLVSAEVASRFQSDVPVIVERAMYTVGADGRLLAGHAATGAAAPSPAWYFAEGATGSLFSTFLLLSNPSERSTTAEVTFLLPSGQPVRQYYELPAEQRRTVWVNHATPQTADTSLGMEVRALDGTPIIAERAMWWPGDGSGFRASHLSGGITRLSPAWAFAEGEYAPERGEYTYVLVANAGDRGATVTVTLLPESGAPVSRPLWVGANARANVDVGVMFPEARDTRFGILLEADDPDAQLLAERSHYRHRPGMPYASGTNATGRDPRVLLTLPPTPTLSRGGPAAVLDGLTSVPGATLDAFSSTPGVVRVEVRDGQLVLTPEPGGSGWTTITITATAPDGRRETRGLRVRVGTPVSRVHEQTMTGPGSYTLPSVGSRAVTYDGTTIQNTGTVPFTDIALFADGRDWTSVDAIVAAVTAGLSTSDEKARALWQFARSSHAPGWSPTINTDVHDPVVLLNGFGYGLCDDISSVLALLFERAGLPSRMWNLGEMRHTVVEAWYDGAWHMFDASLDGLYFRRDNATIAGAEDLIADPWLVARGGPMQALAHQLWLIPGQASYPGLLLAREGRRMALTLHPGEHVTLQPFSEGRLRFSDGSVPTNGEILPPRVMGRGQLLSVVDVHAPTSLDRWHEVRGLQSGSAGLQRTPGIASAEATLEIASPWPVIGGRVRALVQPGALGESLTLEVSASGTGFDFDWSELVSGRFRVPGLHVQDGNLRTFAPDQWGPAVHNGPSPTPGYIEYRFRPLRRAGARTILGGDFYRAGPNDIVAAQVSSDFVHWTTVWQMPHVGGASLSVDLTTAVANCAPCGVRLLVQSASGPAHAGFDALRLEGVEPFAWQPVWSSSGGEGTGLAEVTVPVHQLVNAFDGSMVFGYHVRLRISGTGTPTAALASLELDSYLRVAPRSIATPGGPPVRLLATRAGQGPGQLRITHRWFEDEQRHRPPAPVPVTPTGGTSVSVSAPVALAWAPVSDPDGDVIVGYQAQICDRSDCLYPLSSVFDQRNSPTYFGPDEIPGTADDGPPIAAASTHLETLVDWLRPGAAYYWRVRVLDASGLWSDYGPIAAFTTSP